MNRLAALSRHLPRQTLRANPSSPLLFTSTSLSQLTRKMTTLTGSCYCKNIQYEVSLNSPDDARTSLCHCRNCKKAFGTNYGLTAKIPKDALKITQGKTKEHSADNGSGMVINREFCDNCGSFILEYGDAVKDKFRYIVVGSLDDPEALPPKGEFFCKDRVSWMPEVPNVFHKKEIKE